MEHRRRPGRPALDPDHASASINLTVSAKDYDAAYQRASRQRESVPELVRRALRRELARDERDSDED